MVSSCSLPAGSIRATKAAIPSALRATCVRRMACASGRSDWYCSSTYGVRASSS